MAMSVGMQLVFEATKPKTEQDFRTIDPPHYLHKPPTLSFQAQHRKLCIHVFLRCDWNLGS